MTSFFCSGFYIITYFFHSALILWSFIPNLVFCNKLPVSFIIDPVVSGVAININGFPIWTNFIPVNFILYTMRSFRSQLGSFITYLFGACFNIISHFICGALGIYGRKCAY